MKILLILLFTFVQNCQTSTFNQDPSSPDTSDCGGAVIETVKDLGGGMYSGTFSGKY